MIGPVGGTGTVAPMDTRRLRAALVLSGWTVLVWTTRIRNIWTDDSLSTSGQLWRTAIAVVFTAFAAVTIGEWVRARRTGVVAARAATWIRAFAAWTVVVWLIRGVQIGVADHGAAFKIVHTALAVVSIGLAWWADREAHRTSRSQLVAASRTAPRRGRV